MSRSQPTPTREPGTLAPDPWMTMLVSGYYAKLPHYVLDDVWVQESDKQHYCAVGYANLTPLEPGQTRIMHVMQIPTGELRFTEVEWIDASQRYEDVHSLRIVREHKAAEQRVVEEQTEAYERSMEPLVIRNVNAKRPA